MATGEYFRVPGFGVPTVASNVIPCFRCLWTLYSDDQLQLESSISAVHFKFSERFL